MRNRKLPLSSLVLPGVIATALVASPAFAQQDTQAEAKDSQKTQHPTADKAAGKKVDASQARNNDATRADAPKGKDSKKSKKSDDPTYEPEEDDDR